MAPSPLWRSLCCLIFSFGLCAADAATAATLPANVLDGLKPSKSLGLKPASQSELSLSEAIAQSTLEPQIQRPIRPDSPPEPTEPEPIDTAPELSPEAPPESEPDLIPLPEETIPEPEPIVPLSELEDVAPGSWEYQVLQLISEQQGCQISYPEGRELEQPLTRFEFAADLDRCLTQLSTQFAENLLSDDELLALRRLQTDFDTELTALQTQADGLDGRVSALESAQFSTTGRLNILSSFNLGYATAAGDILAEGDPLPGVIPSARLGRRQFNPDTGRLDPVVGRVSEDPPVTFSHSTYLILQFSFTESDLLTTIMAMGNGNPPAGTFASAGFTSTYGIPYTDANPVPPNPANDLGLLELKYSFSLGDDLQITIGPKILPFRHFDANLYTDVIKGASGLNFYQSTLANSGLTGAGTVIDWFISPELTLRAGYMARNDAALTFYGGGDGPSNPDRGLFGGTNSILAELTYSPTYDTNIRLLYIRDRLDAPPASAFGPAPPFLLSSLRGIVDDGVGGRLNDVIAHNFVLNFDWLLSPRFALFGRYSYSIANIDPINSAIDEGTVNLQAFQLGAAFPDLGKIGALGTLAMVIPFDVVSGQRYLVAGNGDGGTQVDLAAVYSYPVTDEISLIPSFFVTFNANNFNENPVLYSATLRLQFLF